DEHVVSYHWEEVKGPLREEKVSADTPILKLANLVPGNYTFSLTVVDSDGARGSALASLSVLKAVDYPPVANAGPNQVITLPQNSITLFGNQSTDDHGLLSYEWSLSPQSKDKVVEMQGVRTSTLQLSAMQEGDYTYQLTVTDSANQQDTAEVTVIVQPENNKPPRADAGPEKELTLPVDSTTLDGSKSSDDQKIASYRWEKTSGPDGVKIENADSAVATVTGLQVGVYEFTLSVRDERNLASSDTVRVIVKEDWSVLYVTIASFVMLVAVGILSWGLLCCCRGKGKPKRKSRYKILEGTDDQESLELKHSAKGGARLKAPVHPHSSLLRSESEGDSEDPLFTWPDREKGKLLRHQNGSVRNGHGPNRTRKQSCEEQL
ncbi:K319L protein, partial [Polyodon spathula]|nr:K319L protein [Polyodon spathula]